MKMDSPCIVHTSPDRPNIRYSVVETSRECTKAFLWLLDELQQSGRSTKRVLVYCRSIQTCAQLYKFFLTSLQEHSYDNPSLPFGIPNRLFAMFHSRVDKKDKEMILDSMKDPNGACRVVFCTVAFGMGVDIPNIRTIIHYGPPSDIEDYVQETGRGGRDGLECNACLYLHPGYCEKVSPEMKKYIKNTVTCRRVMLMQSFHGNEIEPMKYHTCCDVCQLQCTCSSPCNYQIESWAASLQADVEEELPDPVRNPTIEQLTELRVKLLQFRDTILQCCDPEVNLFVGADIASGLPVSVIDSIIENVEFIGNPADLDLMCHVWNYSSDIFDIIVDICD